MLRIASLEIRNRGFYFLFPFLFGYLDFISFVTHNLSNGRRTSERSSTLVLLQVVFMVWKIMLIISAW